MSVAKVPREPPGLLRFDADDICVVEPVLWRIHPTTGAHVTAWSQLRAFGPIASCRWDPHDPPATAQPDSAVLYAATDLATAAAEVFQQYRRIDTAGRGVHATSWLPIRGLRLLDLSGDWPIKNQAAAALSAAPRSTCRTWARHIRAAAPDLDGLWTGSTMTGRPVVVLFPPAADSFPSAPDFSEPLAAPGMWSVMQAIADRFGYAIA